MAGLLEGKVAVVTGGATGIGLATAKKFVAEGVHVFIFGGRETELGAAVAAIGAHMPPVRGDVTKLSDLDRLYSAVKVEKGKLDIVFANAAIAERAGNRRTLRPALRHTLHLQVRSIDVARLIGRKERHRVGDLVGLCVPTERHSGTEVVVERFQVGTGTCKPIKPRHGLAQV